MTTEANPLDAADEEFSIGGDAADGQKSKYDFSGNFLVEITDVKYGKAKSSENMIYTVTLVGQEGPALGLVFTDYQPEFKNAEMVKLFGILKNPETGKVNYKKSQIVGKQVVAKFKSELYEVTGKSSAKVQGYSQVGTSSPLPGGAPAGGDDIPF